MSADKHTRAEAMESRVMRTLDDIGLGASEMELIRAAHRLAMAHRLQLLDDAHDPALLHPGRTVLILTLDVAFRDAAGLAAAALVESEQPELRVTSAVVQKSLGHELAAWVAAVPIAGDGLTETLVTAPHAVRLVALAERLDQCRHAKFWADRDARLRAHEQAQAVYGPVAERTDAALARRFAHWSRAFAERLRQENQIAPE